MRRSLPIALAALLALTAAGCGATDDSTPEACLDGAGPYLQALEEAPGGVTLAGGVPISDCIAQNQTGGDLATAGDAMLEATTTLNAEAREKPGGHANVELGYLLGAAQKGAAETEGIHAELVRRLAAAARYSANGQPLPAVFLDAYQRGYDAGRESG